MINDRACVRVPIGFIFLWVALLGCGRQESLSSFDFSESNGSRSVGSDGGRAEEFNAATRHYGALVVREGDFEAESPVRPWSSWWFPTRDTYLFQGKTPGSSPLEKYDHYLREAHQIESTAARYEREKLHDPHAGPWEGLCNAWSAAALLVPEPQAPVTLAGVTFGVGDLKALIVKNFERVEGLQQFGQRYNGDRRSVFDDVYPEQFHRVVQAEIFEKKRPFILDKDPGVAVWNTPVWKAQMRIARDSSHPEIMHVTSWIFGASPFVEHYDDVGTLSVVLQYTYDLYGQSLADGSFQVNGGVWTGDSLDFHPDFLTVLPEKPSHQGLNPQIQWKFVQEILGRS